MDTTLKQQASNGVYDKPEFHLEGRKRLEEAINDYSLTMQHAIRSNLTAELVERAVQEADVLPPLTAAEMFDYLADSDSEFFNWCFPFCAYRLTKEKLSYLHSHILSQYRRSLDPVAESDSPSQQN